jgi:hypothetical protein
MNLSFSHKSYSIPLLFFPLFYLGLSKLKTYFGRGPFISSTPDDDIYMFCEENFERNYDKISKEHFMIEFKTEPPSEDPEKVLSGVAPAILHVLGVNGLKINDVYYRKGKSKILMDDDVILLPHDNELGRFSYKGSVSSIVPLSCGLHRKYHVGTFIAKGGNASVYRSYHRVPIYGKDGPIFTQVAIKVIDKPSKDLNEVDSAATVAKLRTEIEIMRSLKDKHIISLIETYETPQKILIVLPLMHGDNLINRILHYYPGRQYMLESDAKFFFLQLMLGLKYLHKKAIAHRDIKVRHLFAIFFNLNNLSIFIFQPDNILFTAKTDSPILKISDFGLSKNAYSLNTRCGTDG